MVGYESMADRESKLRVLVADDNPRVRQGITEMLQGCCEVCGEAGNGAEAVSMVRALGPDVVLLDLSMPVLSGGGAAEAIRAIAPSTRIVFISIDDTPRVASLVKSFGADGFVSKNCGAAVFRETIEMILRPATPRAS